MGVSRAGKKMRGRTSSLFPYILFLPPLFLPPLFLPPLFLPLSPASHPTLSPAYGPLVGTTQKRGLRSDVKLVPWPVTLLPTMLICPFPTCARSWARSTDIPSIAVASFPTYLWGEGGARGARGEEDTKTRGRVVQGRMREERPGSGMKRRDTSLAYDHIRMVIRMVIYRAPCTNDHAHVTRHSRLTQSTCMVCDKVSITWHRTVAQQ